MFYFFVLLSYQKRNGDKIKMTTKEMTYFRAEPSLKERLKAYAEDNERTLSSAIVYLLKEILKIKEY